MSNERTQIPKAVQEAAEHYNKIIEAVARGLQIGEEFAVPHDEGGQTTREAERIAVAEMAQKYRNYPGRLRDTRAAVQKPTTLEQCEALVKRAGAVADRRIFNQHLMADAIFTAVFLLHEALHPAKGGGPQPSPRGRGRPRSAPNSPPGREFIRRIAEVWILGTGCHARGGDGRTDSRRFNDFLVRAFNIAGVSANKYSLPRTSREVLR